MTKTTAFAVPLARCHFPPWHEDLLVHLRSIRPDELSLRTLPPSVSEFAVVPTADAEQPNHDFAVSLFAAVTDVWVDRPWLFVTSHEFGQLYDVMLADQADIRRGETRLRLAGFFILWVRYMDANYEKLYDQMARMRLLSVASERLRAGLGQDFRIKTEEDDEQHQPPEAHR